MTDRKWTIELVEMPLKSGWFKKCLSRIFLGNVIGHSYLALKDPDGTIKQELHGLHFDPHTDKFARISHKNIIDTLTNAFNESIDFDDGKLRTRLYQGASIFTQRFTPEFNILTAGSEQTMQALWERAKTQAENINKKDYDYRLLSLRGEGYTCHSVTSDLIEAMDLEMPKLKYNAPGVKRKLYKNTSTPENSEPNQPHP